MKNKLKFIGILIGAIVLVLVGFGLGRWSVDEQIKELENRVAFLEDKVEEIIEYLKNKDNNNTPPDDIETSTILHVYDGDTVKVKIGEREEKVRLFGINTPEMGQCYFWEAKERLEDLIEGKEVQLEKDLTDRDIYGRLLRYIWLDDLLVNAEILEGGYAHFYAPSGRLKYQDRFLAAEKEAKEAKIKIWTPSEFNSCVAVTNFHYDAASNDNYNLNDEYIILKNTCSLPINMTGWVAKDEATHIFTFPIFSLGPQDIVTLYSGSGSKTTDKLYWGRTGQAIWNNDGDTLYLWDSDCNFVLEYAY